jgi:hypothetical protein
MRKIIYITTLVFLLSSCSSEWILKTANKRGLLSSDTIVSTQVDTVFLDTTVTVEVPGDSAFLVDSVYCDSLNNVVIQRLDEVSGERTRIALELKDGKIYTSALVEAYEKEVRVKDSVLFEYERQIINNGLAQEYANFEIAKLKEEARIAEAKETKWKAQRTWGLVSLILVIFIGIFLLLKQFNLWPLSKILPNGKPPL